MEDKLILWVRLKWDQRGWCDCDCLTLGGDFVFSQLTYSSCFGLFFYIVQPWLHLHICPPKLLNYLSRPMRIFQISCSIHIFEPSLKTAEACVSEQSLARVWSTRYLRLKCCKTKLLVFKFAFCNFLCLILVPIMWDIIWPHLRKTYSLAPWPLHMRICIQI